MGFIDRLVVVLAKFVSSVSTRLGLGAGETWPGEIALTLRPDIARSLASSLPDGVILIAGTNGKTTTSLMAKTVLEHIGDTVVHNATGANLLNGVVSSFIKNSDWLGRVTADAGIFEVDENSLPIVLAYVKPTRILLLNLFRDQLDRYGEVDVIVEKWQKALTGLPESTTVILNADDPGIAYLGKAVPGPVLYYGLEDRKKFAKTAEHATDSLFCPSCGSRLSYEGTYYSHIGIWRCRSCGLQRQAPAVTAAVSPLPGLYNLYNTLAVTALSRSLDIPAKTIAKAIREFKPAFGRQETMSYRGKRIRLFLSKNPAGFNASLRTVLELNAGHILFVLNDRIPDGRDVSWIWDVDFEMIPGYVRVYASGDRAHDMALRLKYAGLPMPASDIFTDPSDALESAAESADGTLFVLATYSGMLEVRKHIKGRKIL